MNTQQSNPKSFFLTPIQTVFLASMIAADFGFGMVVKNLLAPTHILNVVRIDMVVPFMLMLLTRVMIDRFGVLILYEGVWGLLSVLAMPGAFGLPGFLKLLPALSQGLILDAMMTAFKRFPTSRLYISAIVGGAISTIVFFGLKLALGMPWLKVVQILFGLQMLTNLIVWALGAYLTKEVYGRIHSSQMARRIAFVPDN